MSERKPKRSWGLLDDAVAALPPDAPQETKDGAARVKRQQESLEKAEGFGATVAGQAIAGTWLSTLETNIKASLAERPPAPLKELFGILRQLPADVLALCILQTALDTVAQYKTKGRDDALKIADAIAGECWAYNLLQERPDLAEQLEKRVRRRKSFSTKRQRQMAYANARRAGYRTPQWDRERRLQAGIWAINQLMTLRNVFTTATTTKKGGPEIILALTDNALSFARGVINELIQRNPVWRPQTEPPLDWSDLNKGGASDKRLSLAAHIISRHSKRNDAAVRAAICDRTMQPTLNALNALQRTAWTINRKVLEVMNSCVARKIYLPRGLQETDNQLPDAPAEWENMDKDAWRQWRMQVEGVEERNRKRRSKRVLFDQDLATANRLVECRFWTPMNLDWRGRVYSIPHFSFQREDYVRGLFLFADGEPIGEKGLYWLKVHVANCADHEDLGCKGISKRPFAERVKWTEEYLPEIERIAEAPLKELKWRHADSPFQFLAACFELSSALTAGPAYEARLPICFDGSCSGLQHLSAMMRDADTAALVNLTDSAIPNDLYQSVAERVRRRVEDDEKNAVGDKRRFARMWLDYGISRAVVKRNVMTFGYGSVIDGMAKQLDEEVMGRLPEEHPFGDEEHKASWYLAPHTYHTIEEAVHSAAVVKRFLKKLVRALAKGNKPMRWNSPSGFPFVNQYSKPHTKSVKLWLQKGDGTRVRHTIKTAVDDLPTINAHKAIKGAAPNFVHACDAAHLMLTVNAAVAEGITSIATVHDSFGCLAARAERFRQIIREQFARMYEEHDVLAEVLEQAQRDLGEDGKNLPALPTKGSLEIKRVLDAQYAFA